jgi:hypothetical protein
MICAIAAAIGRALVPAGYMPAPHGGRISIVLCGSGHEAALDLGGDRAPGGRKGAAEGGCVFAVATAMAPPAILASISAPGSDPVAGAAKPLPRATRGSLGLAAPPPPSHAPPVSV